MDFMNTPPHGEATPPFNITEHLIILTPDAPTRVATADSGSAAMDGSIAVDRARPLAASTRGLCSTACCSARRAFSLRFLVSSRTGAGGVWVPAWVSETQILLSEFEMATHHVGGNHTTLSSTVPWDLAESQRIAGKCWPKVAGFFATKLVAICLNIPRCWVIFSFCRHALRRCLLQPQPRRTLSPTSHPLARPPF
jgi:hypothetical protein